MLFRPEGCGHSDPRFIRKGRMAEKPQVTQPAGSNEVLYFWERARRVWETDI